MSWPKNKALVPMPPGKFLSDATDEEYASEHENLLRWQLARKWRDAVLAKKTSKAAIWTELKDEPEEYREDMLDRLKHYFGGSA